MLATDLAEPVATSADHCSQVDVQSPRSDGPHPRSIASAVMRQRSGVRRAHFLCLGFSVEELKGLGPLMGNRMTSTSTRRAN